MQSLKCWMELGLILAATFVFCGCNDTAVSKANERANERADAAESSAKNNSVDSNDPTVAFVSAPSDAEATTDWPDFLGVHRDSVSSEKGILKDWKGGLRQFWKLPVGEGYAIGTVRDGHYFHFDRDDDNARCRCFTVEPLKEVWSYEYETTYTDRYGYDGGPRTSPILDEERLYLFGVEGMLICLNAETGKEIWKVNTSKEYGVIQNFFGVGSCPVVYKDLLLVMVGGSGKEGDSGLIVAEGDGSGIVAFNKKTGKEIYKFSDELASYSSLKLAHIAGRDFCFAFTRGGLLAFDPANGKQDFFFKWRARILESVNAATPVVVGDQVFISETYGPGSALLRVDPKLDAGYEVVWQDDLKSRDKAMQAHWNTPIEVGGYIYGCSGRHTSNAELRCIEVKTGKVMWSEPRMTRTSLLAIDGHFLCMGEDGVLRLLKINPHKYEELQSWEVTINTPKELKKTLTYPCWAAPIVSDGKLYLRGRDNVVCLELIPKENQPAGVE